VRLEIMKGKQDNEIDEKRKTWKEDTIHWMEVV
jgi:hypothetical protein